jgi:hypothetical protein
MSWNTSKTVSKKMELQPNVCIHMASEKGDASFQRAMIYLKLIDVGCKRQKSLNFAAKRVCRADCTATEEGPQDYGLKIKKEKHPFHINGWLNSEHQYDMGTEFRNGMNDIVKDNQQLEHAFNSYVVKNIEKPKLEYHDKLKNFRAFLLREEGKINFKGSEPSEIMKKLRLNKANYQLKRVDPNDILKSPGKKSYCQINPALRTSKLTQSITTKKYIVKYINSATTYIRYRNRITMTK